MPSYQNVKKNLHFVKRNCILPLQRHLSFKWIKFHGVRYRKHPTRKHGVKMDQYFTIRYKLNGKDKEEGLDGKRSPRSMEYALSVVRQVFNTAKRLGVFEGENPTKKIKFPKPDNGMIRYLTRDEAARLLDTLKAKSHDVHDMTLLSLHAGLRFGEIASLTWQDVDIERGVLTIPDT